MTKNIYFKFLSIALIFLTSINADDIAGIWKVDKEKAISSIKNIVPEEERFLIERFIIHGLLKELDFKEDGVLEYPLVSDIKGTWKYEKSKKVYLVKAAKDVGQIELYGKDNFVFKNILGKPNLDIHYKRIAYSEIRRKEIEDKSKIYTNQIYRSKATGGGGNVNVYYYLTFTEESNFYSIYATSKDIGLSSVADMKRIIKEENRKHDEPFKSLSAEEVVDRSIMNPIKGYEFSGYKIKDNILISHNIGEFSSIYYVHKDKNNYSLERTSNKCQQIQIINREHLKCDNGLEYFLLNISK